MANKKGRKGRKGRLKTKRKKEGHPVQLEEFAQGRGAIPFPESTGRRKGSLRLLGRFFPG